MTTPQYLIAALIAALLLGRPGPAQAQSTSYVVGGVPGIADIG